MNVGRFIVSFDLKNKKHEAYKEIEKEIMSMSLSCNILTTTYILETEGHTIQSIKARLLPLFGKEDNVFIDEVSPNARMLRECSWDSDIITDCGCDKIY